jgi:hypothetical protein
VQKPPAQTPEQQQAIVARLQEMLAADNELLGSINGSSILCMQQPLNQQRAGQQHNTSHGLRQAISITTDMHAAAGCSGLRSQVNRALTFLNSSRIAAGVDVQRAGTLSWVSSPCMPSPYGNENLVSDWDQVCALPLLWWLFAASVLYVAQYIDSDMIPAQHLGSQDTPIGCWTRHMDIVLLEFWRQRMLLMHTVVRALVHAYLHAYI